MTVAATKAFAATGNELVTSVDTITLIRSPESCVKLSVIMGFFGLSAFL